MIVLYIVMASAIVLYLATLTYMLIGVIILTAIRLLLSGIYKLANRF